MEMHRADMESMDEGAAKNMAKTKLIRLEVRMASISEQAKQLELYKEEREAAVASKAAEVEAAMQASGGTVVATMLDGMSEVDVVDIAAAAAADLFSTSASRRRAAAVSQRTTGRAGRGGARGRLGRTSLRRASDPALGRACGCRPEAAARRCSAANATA